MSNNEMSETVNKDVSEINKEELEKTNNSDAELLENNNDAPNIGKAFAAVKKEYREKGRREGLIEAQKMLENSDKDSQVEVKKSMSVAPLQSVDGVESNVSNILWNNKAVSIEAEGRAKYNDFDVKINEALKKAEGNPTLTEIYKYAVNIGNADTIYDLMTNSEKRARMLEDRSCWSNELYNLNKSESKKLVKNPPTPLSVLNSSSGKGEINYESNKRHVLKLNGII